MWRARAHLQPRHALLNELARVAPALALAARATHRLYRSAPDYVAIAPSRFIIIKLNELLRSALESNQDAKNDPAGNWTFSKKADCAMLVIASWQIENFQCSRVTAVKRCA